MALIGTGPDVRAFCRSLLGIGISALILTGSANAAELCVKCTGPDASYACIVGGSANTTLDTVAKLYCITALAKSGSHASCSVDRTAKPPCAGERREFPLPSILDTSEDDNQTEKPNPPSQGSPNKGSQEAKLPQASPPPGMETGSGNPSTPERPQAGPINEPPPKTVQEMFEKSAKSTGNGFSETQKSAGEAAKSASTALEKAGSAVGGAAKNSWKCLSSFFSNC